MQTFARRAIAFLDILGFKSFICEAEAKNGVRNHFRSLKHVVESHVRWDNKRLAPTVPRNVKPKYLFISDSIVLSAPIEHNGYDGLAVVAIKCIEIAHKLLEMGFLVKGGVAVGNVWHESKNIFGTAYIDAYLLQEKGVPGPHIVLCNSASDHLQTASHRSVPLNGFDIWRSFENGIRLDALHPNYIRGIEAHGRVEHAFSQYSAWISQRVVDPDLAAGPRAKWEEMRLLVNQAIARHGVGVLPIPDVKRSNSHR